MNPSGIIGAALAVASALVWGSGDFSGGLAARKLSPWQVTSAAAFSGLASLLILMVLRAEAWPDGMGAVWSALAGLAGALGIACLYSGLATGGVAITAAISGVISAAIPVAFGAISEGTPPPLKLIGFALGLVSIALVSQTGANQTRSRRATIVLATSAGIGFGMFFVLISNVKGTIVFSPLVIARATMLVASLLLMVIKGERFPNLAVHPIAILAGVLDAGGNVLFLFARQFTRLDVASVLSSLYPASTILLARIFLHERLRRIQIAGVMASLVAIALIVV